MSKKCSKCNKEYPATLYFFSKNKRSSDGLFSWCKTCKQEGNKKSHVKHLEERNKKRKIFRDNNREKIRLQNKKYLEKIRNPNRKRKPRLKNMTEEELKIHIENNNEKIKKQKIEYYNRNKNKIREYKRMWQEKNKIKISENQKKYRGSHKRQRCEYNRNRKAIDINFKILCNMRSRLSRALKKHVKSDRTVNLLGCTINQLKDYLKLNFMDGMTFENYGIGLKQWSLDHIIPCAAFDLSDPKQQKECFHYLNIRPLWNVDNFKKNSLYNGVYIRVK